MAERVQVSLLDLTVTQVEQLEEEFGSPVDEWPRMRSRMRVYRRIYGLVTGADDATVGAMSVRDLLSSVDLGDAADSGDAETENPTDQPNG